MFAYKECSAARSHKHGRAKQAGKAAVALLASRLRGAGGLSHAHRGRKSLSARMFRLVQVGQHVVVEVPALRVLAGTLLPSWVSPVIPHTPLLVYRTRGRRR